MCYNDKNFHKNVSDTTTSSLEIYNTVMQIRSYVLVYDGFFA